MWARLWRMASSAETPLLCTSPSYNCVAMVVLLLGRTMPVGPSPPVGVRTAGTKTARPSSQTRDEGLAPRGSTRHDGASPPLNCPLTPGPRVPPHRRQVAVVVSVACAQPTPLQPMGHLSGGARHAGV